MKKNCKIYIAIWCVVVAVFNVIAFVVPGWKGSEKFTTTFFIGYGLIMLSLIGQLVVFLLNTRKTLDKSAKFLKLPLIYISIISLIVSAVVGIACAVFTFIPVWIAVCISIIALAVMAIGVLMVELHAKSVTETSDKIRQKTSFISKLTVTSESLIAQAQTEKIKNLTIKVYEAIRYSDPMSCEDLEEIETQVKNTFDKFSVAVKDNDELTAEKIFAEVISVVTTRNNACKALK